MIQSLNFYFMVSFIPEKNLVVNYINSLINLIFYELY